MQGFAMGGLGRGVLCGEAGSGGMPSNLRGKESAVGFLTVDGSAQPQPHGRRGSGWGRCASVSACAAFLPAGWGEGAGQWQQPGLLTSLHGFSLPPKIQGNDAALCVQAPGRDLYSQQTQARHRLQEEGVLPGYTHLGTPSRVDWGGQTRATAPSLLGPPEKGSMSLQTHWAPGPSLCSPKEAVCTLIRE